MAFIFLFLILGMVCGYIKRRAEIFSKIQSVILFALLFFIGTLLGSDSHVIQNISVIGLRSLWLAMACTAGSVAFVLLFNKKLRFNAQENNMQPSNGILPAMYQSLYCLLFLSLGVAAGYFFPKHFTFAASAVTYCLWGLLFIVGMDLAAARHMVFTTIRAYGLRILFIPFAALLGGIIGSIICGVIISLPVGHAAAVGSAMGWYSISGVMLSSVSAELGAIAYLTNVLREAIAILLAPWLARLWGIPAAVAPAGATAMDTSLPIISKATNAAGAAVAFVSGSVLSLIVPFLLEFFIGIL